MAAGEQGESPVLKPEDRLPQVILPEVIKDKRLTFEEASSCLNTLGKDESGSRYAYLMITATNRKLTDISIILNFKHVLFLDLSGNYLNMEALQVLADMPYLILLKAEANRVESVALKPMYFLQVLNLNRNLIKDSKDINQPLLETLELNFNEISDAEFSGGNLEKLKQLELRSNRLFELNGIYPITLQKMFLPVNGISYIEPTVLSTLTSLELLHVRDNLIRKLNSFTEDLANLKYLNLRNNKIEKFHEIRNLQTLPKLETLVILGNPITEDENKVVKGEGETFGEEKEEDMSRSRLIILTLLPNLKRLNKMVVTSQERYKVSLFRDEVLRQLQEEPNSDDEVTIPDLVTDYLKQHHEIGEIGREEE